MDNLKKASEKESTNAKMTRASKIIARFLEDPKLKNRLELTVTHHAVRFLKERPRVYVELSEEEKGKPQGRQYERLSNVPEEHEAGREEGTALAEDEDTALEQEGNRRSSISSISPMARSNHPPAPKERRPVRSSLKGHGRPTIWQRMGRRGRAITTAAAVTLAGFTAFFSGSENNKAQENDDRAVASALDIKKNNDAENRIKPEPLPQEHQAAAAATPEKQQETPKITVKAGGKGGIVTQIMSFAYKGASPDQFKQLKKMEYDINVGSYGYYTSIYAQLKAQHGDNTNQEIQKIMADSSHPLHQTFKEAVQRIGHPSTWTHFVNKRAKDGSLQKVPYHEFYKQQVEDFQQIHDDLIEARNDTRFQNRQNIHLSWEGEQIDLHVDGKPMKLVEKLLEIRQDLQGTFGAPAETQPPANAGGFMQVSHTP